MRSRAAILSVMRPQITVGGGVTLTLVSVQNGNPTGPNYNGSSVTVTTEQAGDLVIAVGGWFDAAPVPSAPTGGGTWTQLCDITNATANQSEMAVYYKTSTGGASNTYTLPISPADAYVGAQALLTVYVLRKSDASTPAIALGATYNGSANPITLSAFTAAASTGFLLVPVCAYNNPGGTPTGTGLTFVSDGGFSGVLEASRYHASIVGTSVPAITITGQDFPACAAVIVVT